MRRIVFLVLFLSTKSFAQEWVDYCHDSTLIISMPYYYYEREENGFLVSTAKIEGGLITVSHMPDNPPGTFNIRDASDLKQAYFIIRDELVKTQGGELLKSDIIKKEGLTWIYFIAQSTEHGIDQTIYNCVVFVNDGMYILTFFEMGPPTHEKDEARKNIFSSARIAPKISKNQISSMTYDSPFPFKNFLASPAAISAAIAAIIIFTFLIVWFKRKGAHMNKRNIAVGFSVASLAIVGITQIIRGTNFNSAEILGGGIALMTFPFVLTILIKWVNRLFARRFDKTSFLRTFLIIWICMALTSVLSATLKFGPIRDVEPKSKLSTKQ